MDPLMMALMGEIGARDTGEVQGPPEPIGFDDPEAALEMLREQFDLSDEEVAELSVPSPPGGPSLADRIRQLRSQANVGGVELGVDGQRVTGRVEF